MERRLLQEFQRQVWLQCLFAANAYGEIDRMIVDGLPIDVTPMTELADRPRGDVAVQAMMRAVTVNAPFWGAVQSFLTAAANISKAFWGQGGKLAKERTDLRVSLNVSDASAIKTTLMRNHFDHFDERLDAWWADAPRRRSADLNLVIEFDLLAQTNLTPVEVFRNFDLRTRELIFWGQRYSLPVMHAELERIREPAGLQGLFG